MENGQKRLRRAAPSFQTLIAAQNAHFPQIRRRAPDAPQFAQIRRAVARGDLPKLWPAMDIARLSAVEGKRTPPEALFLHGNYFD